MRRIIILFIAILLAVSLQGFFRDFAENPADIADRESGDIILPGFYINGGFSNNHLKVSDLSMFEEGHVLTQSEKDVLTSSNLNFSGYGSFNLFACGYRNWELTMTSNIRSYIGDIDKEFMQILFSGNDEDQYNTSAMSDTYLYQFIKLSFDWAYPKSVNLSLIPPARISNKESGSFVLKLESVLNYLRETDIYLGARVNVYNSAGYAEVMESEQELISSQDSLYAESHVSIIHTDYDTLSITGNYSTGFGLGLKMKLPNGWMYFNVDDLGTKLTYSDLVYSDYYNYHLDYLNFIDEDHEAIDESETVESEDYGKDREVKLDASLTFGVEYYVGRGFDVMAKYQSCDYLLDGLFLGTTYRPLEWLPIKLTYGNGDVDSYSFKFGVDSESMELMLGGTYYNGLFNAAKGYGADFGIKFKF